MKNEKTEIKDKDLEKVIGGVGNTSNLNAKNVTPTYNDDDDDDDIILQDATPTADDIIAELRS